MRVKSGLGAVIAVASMIILPAHGQVAGQGGSPKVVVRGAGATFPAPLYEKWIMTFRKQNPDLIITYDVVGSGEGEKRFLANAVDFGASDAALRDEQLASVKPGAQLVPVTAGMVVLAYNLPGLGGDLQLSRGVLADVFAGTILTWTIRGSAPIIPVWPFLTGVSRWSSVKTGAGRPTRSRPT